MSQFCSQCGTRLEVADRFCPSCGTVQSEAAPSAPSAPPVFPGTPAAAPSLDGSTGMQPSKARHRESASAAKAPPVPETRNPGWMLILALCCLSVFPDAASALMMLLSKQAVHPVAVACLQALGAAGAALLFCRYLCAACTRPFDRRTLSASLGGLLWMGFVGMGWLRVADLYQQTVATRSPQYAWFHLAVAAAGYAATLFVLTLLAYQTLLRVAADSRTVTAPAASAGKAASRPGLLRQPGLFWRTLALTAATLLVPDAIRRVAAIPNAPIATSFVSTMTISLLIASLQALFLRLLVLGMLRAVSRQTQPDLHPLRPDSPYGQAVPSQAAGMAMPTTPPAQTAHQPTLIAGALALLLLLAAEPAASIVSGPAGKMAAEVRQVVEQGSAYLNVGDIDNAMTLFDRASTHAQAWLAFSDDVGDGAGTLASLRAANPSDELIAWLYAARNPSIPELERAVLSEWNGFEWKLALLAAYRAQETNPANPVPLAEQQEAIRSDLLHACMAAGCYVSDTITPKEAAANGDKIRQGLSPYQAYMTYYAGYRILRDEGLSGGMTPDIMNRLLAHAQENPDNLLAQYMAYAAGSTWLYDEASHYAGTAKAAIRFGEIFLSQNPTPEAEAAVRLEVANALMAVHDYANATTWFEAAVKSGAALDSLELAAECQDRLGNPGKCLTFATTALQGNPDSVRARMLAMNAALKSGKVTESLQQAVQLLERMPSLEGDDYLSADTALYLYIQYLTVQDPTQWTPEMKYRVYPDLDAAQQAILDKNPLFGDYVKAMHFTFDRKDTDQALPLVENLLKQMPNSAQVHYLAGTIHFNRREFEQAVTQYKASLAIDENAPTLWYALANAYDALQRYKEAYDCTLRVRDMLATNNHTVDLYGVQYHNGVLMEGLARKLKEGGVTP